MARVAKLTHDGSLSLKGTLNERLPVITNGLVAHYPLDGPGGAIDVINGAGTVQNAESGANILDALSTDWRDPANWTWYLGAGGTLTWDAVESALVLTSNGAGSWFSFTSPYIPISTARAWFMSAFVKQSAGATGTFFMGTLSYDSAKTFLQGHPGTGDWFGASNISIPTTSYQYLMNQGTGGVAKTGESAPLGDLTTFPVGTKYVCISIVGGWGGTTGSTYIKGLRFWNTTANTSNANVTPDGLAVEEATTNLILTPTTFSGWTDAGAITITFNQPDPFGRLNAVKMSSNGTGEKYFGDATAQGAGTYTMSVWLRASKAITIPLKLGENDCTYNCNITTQWTLFSGTMTTAGGRRFHLGGWGSWMDQTTTVWMAYPQLEQRTFATSFVNGARSASTLNIPLPVSAFPFTASVLIYNDILNGGNGEGGEPGNAYPLSWWGPYLGVLNQISRANSYYQLPFFRLTLICRATTFDIYFDRYATLGSTYYASTPSAFTTPLSLGTRTLEEGYGRMNAKYAGLSIWNRELSVAEIARIVGESTQVEATKFVIPEYTEQPTNLPSDVYYWPLASDALDWTKSFSSSIGDNLAFETGAVWVGSAVTNLLPASFFSTCYVDGSGQGSVGSAVINVDKSTTIVDVASNTRYVPSSWVIIAAGYDYNVSVRYRKIAGTPTFRWQAQGINSSSVVIQLIWTDGGLIDTAREQILSSNLNFSAGSVNLALLFQDGADYTTYTHSYKLDKPMLTQKSFYSPYTETSRGATNLAFNLNSTLGLDWSGDWSICYWKKPISTYLDTLAGYSIESIGANTGYGATFYQWWGKTNGANTLVANNTPLTGSTWGSYFNEWHFVSLVKSGTTVTLTMTGKDFKGSTTFTGPSTATACVTSFGYDFKLGGWDNGNPPNAYYRDLVVAKRALSLTELTGLRRQMKISKATILTESLIEEGI